jgi:hypothetical protein
MSLEDIEEGCKCVGKHVPLPRTFIGLGVEDTFVNLCPTAFENLKEYLGEWEIYDHEPPGHRRKHYSEYTQNLAKRLKK